MPKKKVPGMRYGVSGMEELQTELEEMKSLAQRTQADFMNYRRRVEEESSEARTNAQAEVIERVLPTLNTLIDQAGQLGNVPEGLRHDEWVKGMVSLVEQLKSSLSVIGLEEIDLSGEFDPHLHEAVSQTKDSSKHEGAMAELDKGWTFKGRVIRPAKVTVNRKE